MAGRETTEGRLRGSKAGEGGTGNWSWVAGVREPEDDLVWRVRESRFTFRTDRGLVGERRDMESDSEEGPDGGGLSPSATTTLGRLAGGGVILIPRLAGVVFLRGRAVGCCAVGCMMTYRGTEEVTTCVLFREEERGYRTKKAGATDAPDRRGTRLGQLGREGVGVENVANLSNLPPHVPILVQPTPPRSQHRSIDGSFRFPACTISPWFMPHLSPADAQYCFVLYLPLFALCPDSTSCSPGHPRSRALRIGSLHQRAHHPASPVARA